MKRKKYDIIALLILVVSFIVWRFIVIADLDDSFFNIRDWGGYFIITPMIFQAYRVFSNVNTQSSRWQIIFYLMLGGIVSALLGRNVETAITICKLAALFFGALLLCVVEYYRNNRAVV